MPSARSRAPALALVLRCLLGLGLFAVVTVAAPAPMARAAGPSDADKEAAKIHYKAGEQYYLAGHYPDAIKEFSEAYRLSKSPALLYNISEAYEKIDDVENQRNFLQRYIASGKADPGELPALKAKVKELDARMAAAKAPPSTGEQKSPPEAYPEEPPPIVLAPPVDHAPESKPAVAPTPTPVAPPVAVTPPAPPVEVAPPPPTPAPPQKVGPYHRWKWIALGTGLGCGLISALFLADSSKMNTKIEDAVTSPPMTYTTDLDAAYSRGQRDNALGAVFGIAGLGLAATGVVLFIIDKPSPESAQPSGAMIVPVVVPVITPTSAGASASWAF